jgi:hypothetical protein
VFDQSLFMVLWSLAPLYCYTRKMHVGANTNTHKYRQMIYISPMTILVLDWSKTHPTFILNSTINLKSLFLLVISQRLVPFPASTKSKHWWDTVCNGPLNSSTAPPFIKSIFTTMQGTQFQSYKTSHSLIFYRLKHQSVYSSTL